MAEGTHQPIRVYGVRHGDSRNTEIVLELTNSPARPIFHENRPPSQRNLLHFVLWAIATPSNFLRSGLEALGDTGYYESECEKAAKTLAKRESIDVTYIGMSWYNRSKRLFPWHSVVWFPLLYSFPSNLTLIGGIGTTMFGIIFAGLITYPHEHRIREAVWTNRIQKEVRDNDAPVVIVGNDHCQSLSERLRERGFAVEETSIYELLDG